MLDPSTACTLVAARGPISRAGPGHGGADIVKRILGKVIAISVASLLVTPGLAEAHVANFNTRVTLSANDTRIRRGDTVRFTARVTSPRERCFQNRQVQLLKNGDRVETKRTNNNGVAVFTRTPRRTADWKARVNAIIINSTHPHLHRCKGDTSNEITVRVIRNND